MRFISTNLSVTNESPLQIYASALIFAPKKSIIRNTFECDIPNWVSLVPETRANWNQCLQTLEGHTGCVNSVAFSHDSKLLASASDDKTVRVWDTATGALQQTLEGYNRSVSFSSDNLNIITDFGTFNISQPPLQLSQTFKSIKYGIASDEKWVTWNGSVTDRVRRQVSWTRMYYIPKILN